MNRQTTTELTILLSASNHAHYRRLGSYIDLMAGHFYISILVMKPFIKFRAPLVSKTIGVIIHHDNKFLCACVCIAEWVTWKRHAVGIFKL